MDCIFCKIAKGEISSNKVYEDESVFAFLDINPVSAGHTLVIPKKHYENIYDIPEEILEKITIVAKRLVLIYRDKFEIESVNILNSNGSAAQQDVFHYHMHIIPRKKGDGTIFKWESKKVDFDKFLEKLGEVKI
jgi:histidine triad (HIT) family protein